MHFPLIICGAEIERQNFTVGSPFYPGYSARLAHAKALDVAQAIGGARAASQPGLEERVQKLAEAAQAFQYSKEDVAHAVRMTGMPFRLTQALFEQIPEILRQTPAQLEGRYGRMAGSDLQFEPICDGLDKAFAPVEGFCYALTPGNDPRAAALVAANLCFLGIPFVLRASSRDATAPLVIRALLRAGWDPRACSLIYFDRSNPESATSHAHLMEACAIVWTFGPQRLVDPLIRFHPEDGRDLFQGKIVLRHAAGNCAIVVNGPPKPALEKTLYDAIGYPLACTATKSLLVVDEQGWLQQAADFLASLTVGDPLDMSTQVGYIDPQVLDELEALRLKNQARAAFYGGERLSAIQSRPLLAACQEDLPDFFGQEIPAYVLGLRQCSDLAEAVAFINRHTVAEPRLAVSFFNFPREEVLRITASLRTHSLLLDKPTTTLMPPVHEGNDYLLLLTKGKFILG